ncbi:MAG: nicotianamine synthase family protein [Methyloligellaceae bacterium]
MKHAYKISESFNATERDKVSGFLHSVYNSLRTQKDLSPNNELVNLNLTDLVSQIMAWSDLNQFTLADLDNETTALLNVLPSLCAQAECEMEKWWAGRIVNDEALLDSFWYLEQYRLLTSSEIRLIQHLKAQRLVFLGSGALPLTAIIMAQHNPHLELVCIDCDSIACELSDALIKKLGHSPQIRVIESDASSYRYSHEDMVVCASLLRASDIYERLFSSNVSDIIVRDAEDLYRFIYQPAQQPSETNYMEIGRTRLNSKCINISRHFERVVL